MTSFTQFAGLLCALTAGVCLLHGEYGWCVGELALARANAWAARL